jgi:hypothetical protein
MAEDAKVYPLRREPRAPEPLWREVLGQRLRALRLDQQETLAETAGRAGGQQLSREQRPVVVVKHPVQHQDPLNQQLLPDPLAEQGVLLVMCHASSLRHDRPGNPRPLP